MRQLFLVLCVYLASTCLDSAFAGSPLSVDDLVSKNIAARGGIDAIHAMQTLRLSGKLLVNQGQIELAFVQSFKRKGKVRQEASVQGMTQVQAYDGKQGWQIDPFGGRKDPEKMADDSSKGMAESVNEFDGALTDWQAKGVVVSYLGTEDVEGTLAHKIKLQRPNADVEYIYLDPDYFLEIRILSQRVEHGVQLAIETNFGDYEKVSGVFIPFSVDVGKKGSSDRQKIVVEKAELNVALDDSMFTFPDVITKK
ncbi:hypothetical protein [Undibacterium sp. GrIS 1.8]|uniref:hypothetical protein n=1 Tax=Undibacterium sp. GrIS 1.8 TaxID=3143934 RepID=UPI003398DDA7